MLVGYLSQLGNVRVSPGDIVVADDTAVAVIPADKAAELLRECQRREDYEARFEEGLKKGKTFLELSQELKIM